MKKYFIYKIGNVFTGNKREHMTLTAHNTQVKSFQPAVDMANQLFKEKNLIVINSDNQDKKYYKAIVLTKNGKMIAVGSYFENAVVMSDGYDDVLTGNLYVIGLYFNQDEVAVLEQKIHNNLTQEIDDYENADVCYKLMNFGEDKIIDSLIKTTRTVSEDGTFSFNELKVNADSVKYDKAMKIIEEDNDLVYGTSSNLYPVTMVCNRKKIDTDKKIRKIQSVQKESFFKSRMNLVVKNFRIFNENILRSVIKNTQSSISV